MNATSVTANRWIVALLITTGGWWIVAGGEASGWVIGVPMSVLSAWAVFRLFPGSGPGWSWRGLLSFLPYFLRASMSAGWDVARRALAPRMKLEPVFLDYPLRLPPGIPRVVFVNCISLLPGTLSCRLGVDQVRLHALYPEAATEASLSELESRVGAVFTGIRGRGA